MPDFRLQLTVPSPIPESSAKSTFYWSSDAPSSFDATYRLWSNGLRPQFGGLGPQLGGLGPVQFARFRQVEAPQEGWKRAGGRVHWIQDSSPSDRMPADCGWNEICPSIRGGGLSLERKGSGKSNRLGRIPVQHSLISPRM